MVQQTLSRVCRKTNNYFVAFLCISVSSFLLQGLELEIFCHFAGVSRDWQKRKLLFRQIVCYGIMNQFAGSFHADLFHNASPIGSYGVCAQMEFLGYFLHCFSCANH
jgi:hypothetical protein